MKVFELVFPDHIKLNKSEKYELKFDYIVNDFECEGKIGFQFSLRLLFNLETGSPSFKKEIFSSDYKNTNESKKWESKSVCFEVETSSENYEVNLNKIIF